MREEDGADLAATEAFHDVQTEEGASEVDGA